MGVSGCTRECAEAQSKDVGVIATETGWNLYVAGNGGRSPRHADLFATDLTDEQLVQLVDRFLMYYVRTADRLQRTSVWLEALDGGLEHVRDVIVDDSLGICDELDADMALHVDTYECEWKATLADPARLEHFVEFVNAPDEHSTPVWVETRGAAGAGVNRVSVAAVESLPVDRGVAAMVGGEYVAVFRLADGEIAAIDHVDPCSGVPVLARGLVGSVDDVPVVASPLHKQRFDLRTGRCLDSDTAVRVWPVDRRRWHGHHRRTPGRHHPGRHHPGRHHPGRHHPGRHPPVDTRG